MIPGNACSTAETVSRLSPRHTSFVGVDSDGCVFDTMAIKQKDCFHGLIVSHWRLAPIEGCVRETAEFVNLTSVWRGQNRFVALDKTFDLLRQRSDVRTSGLSIPEFRSLKALIRSGSPLGHPALERAAAETGDRELVSLLDWSRKVNAAVRAKVKNIPPFTWARQGLERIREHSDAICISQTPAEALQREWARHDLVQYVSAIAGQEIGTKSEQLALAAKGKYEPRKILVIGDAFGDRRAARSADALFYPINPGSEEASWKRFCDEAYERFLRGEYAGDYEMRVTVEFEALLPESPPWEKGA